MSITAMRQALEALENNRQTHHYCEDTWYSCPKHEDGCANDSEGDECNCGADKANAEIDAAITSLRQAIAEAEKQEPVAWVGLTDEEIDEAVKSCKTTDTYKYFRAIEAALKQKNGH